MIELFDKNYYSLPPSHRFDIMQDKLIEVIGKLNKLEQANTKSNAKAKRVVRRTTKPVPVEAK